MSLNNNNIVDLVKKKKEIIKEKKKQSKSHSSISTKSNNSENKNELNKNTLINNFVTSQKLLKDLQKRDNISLDTSLYLFNVEIDKIQKITKCAKWKNVPYIYQKSATEILLRKNEYISELNKKYKKSIDKKVSPNNVATKRYSSNVSIQRNNNKKVSLRSQTIAQPVHKNLENSTKQKSVSNTRENNYLKKKNNDVFDKLAKKCSYTNTNNLKNNNIAHSNSHENMNENVNKHDNCLFRCSGNYSASTNIVTQEKDENSKIEKENKIKNIKNYKGTFYENTKGLKKNDYYYYDNNNSGSRPRATSAFGIGSEKEKIEKRMESIQNINERNSIWCSYASKDLNNSSKDDENSANQKYMSNYFCYNNGEQDSVILNPVDQEANDIRTKWPEMSCSYFKANNIDETPNEFENKSIEIESSGAPKKTIPNFERHTVSSFIKNLSVQKDILEKKQKQQVRENLKRMPTKQIVENSKKTYSSYDKTTQDNLKNLIKSQKKNDKNKMKDSSFEKIWNTVLKKQDTLNSVKNKSPNDKYDLYHVAPFNDNYSWVKNLRNYSSPAKLKNFEKPKEENKISSIMKVKKIKKNEIEEKVGIKGKEQNKDEQNKLEVDVDLPNDSLNCEDNLVEEDNNLKIKERNCFYNNYIFCGGEEPNENSEIEQENDNEEDDEANKNNMKQYISVLENVKHNLKEGDKNPLEKFNERKSNNDSEIYEYVKNNENVKNNKIFEVLISPQKNINNKNKIITPKYAIKNRVIANNTQNLIPTPKKSISNVSNNLFGYQKYFQNNLNEKKGSNKYFTPSFKITSPLKSSNNNKTTSFQKNNANVNAQNSLETNAPIESKLMCNSCHTASNIKNVESLNSFDEQADKIIYNQSLSTLKELNTQKSGISNSSRDSKKCNEENVNKSNGKFMFFCKNTNVLEKENSIKNEINHVDSINNIDQDPDAYAELNQNYSCYKTLCVYNKFLNNSNEHETVNTLEEAKQIEQNILEKKKSEHFCLSNGMKLVTKNSEQHILNHKANENIGKPITDANIKSRSFSMDTKQQNEQAIEKNISMNSIDMVDEQNGVSCFNIGCSYNSVSKSNNEVEIKKEISESIENYRINDTNVDSKMGFDKDDNNGGCYFNLCKSKGVNSQEYFMKSFENIKSSDAENCEKRKTVSIIDNKNNDKIFEFENKNISNDRKQTYLQDPNDEDINLLKRKETYNHADTIVERKHTYNLSSMDNKHENNLNKNMSQEYVYINKIPSSHNYEVKGIKESIMNSKRATTYSFPVLKENSKNEEANSELIGDFVFIKNKIAIPKLKLDQMKHKNNHHFDIPNYEIKNPGCFSVVQCNQVRLVPFIPPTDNNKNFNSMASFSKNKHPELLKIESNYLSTLNPHKANRSHTFNNNKINEIIVKNNNMLSSNPKKLSTTSACSRSHTFNLNQRITNNNIATNLTSEKCGNNSNAFCSESFISNVFPVFRKTVSKSNIRHGSKLKLPEYQSKTTFQDLKNNSNNVVPNFSYGNISSQSVELKVNDSVNCMNPCICQNVPKSELTNESHLDSGYINIESHNVIANSKCDKQNKSFENVSKKMEEKKNSIPRKQSYKDMILSFFGIKKKDERNEEKDDASNNCQNNGTMNVSKLYNTKSLGRVDSFHRLSKNSSNKNSNDLMTKQSNYFVPQKSFTRSNMNKQIINKTEMQGSSSIHNNNSNLPTNKINSTFGFSNYVNNTPMNINANTNASTKTKTHSLSFFELKNNKPSCTFESMSKVNSNSIHNNNFLCQNLNKQNDKIVSKIENNNIISSIPKVSSDLITPLNLNCSEKISTIGSNKSELNKYICNENVSSFKTCNNCIKEVENIKKENSNSTHIKESPLIESAFKDILSTERILQNSFKNNLPNKPISIPNIGIHNFFGNRTTESNIIDVQNDNIDVKSNITENKNINNEALEINKQNIDTSSNFKEDTNNKCYNTYHQKNFQIIPFDKSDKKIIAKEVEPENKQVLNHNYTNLFISKSTIDILNKKINNVIYNPHSINMKFNPYDNMNQQNTDINDVILKPNISMDSKNSTTSALQQHIHLSNINQGPSYQTNNTQNETPKKDEPLLSIPVLSEDGDNYEEEEGDDYEEEEEAEEYEEEGEDEEYEEEEEAEEYEEEGEDEEYEEEGEDEEYEEGEEVEEYEEGEEVEEYEEEYEEESDTHLLSPPSMSNEHIDESKDDEYNPEMKYPEKYMKKLPPFNSLSIKNDKYKKMESSNDIFVLSPSNLSNIPNKNILSVYPPSTSSSFNINLFEKKRKSISTLISKTMNSNEESNEGIYKNSENIYCEQDKKIPMAILRNDRESTFSNNNNSYKFFDEIAKQVEYEKKNNEQLKKKLKEQINMQRSLSKLREQQYAQLQFLKHKDVYNMSGNMYA
ncbi:conserved Plasmodium protein, unknown function [Plasmodium vinckei lentum]|uniref:Uncharacterized protein n=1 Tax=Plasmodium vinckei lentum TaxID=138297 RepID=A0A6V7SAU1_PLAVN|nr:conserved Plasmodium protein, unknown function [Plasmodium vinckei lentum]